MGTFDYTITTTASVDQVREFLADLRNLESFVSAVEAVERTGDGYRVTLDRGLLMTDMVIDYSVEVQDSAVVATGTHATIDLVDRWDVGPSGEGAEVRYLGTYELKGASKLGAPFSKVFGEVTARQLARALRERLDALNPA